MMFYLGTHRPSWLALLDLPLFVSRTTMPKRRFPRARTAWALDSGGFTELDRNGCWTVTEREYVVAVRRISEEVGRMAWAAPQDWMCEPKMLKRTGLTVSRHQRLTVDNYLALRYLAPDLPFIPVLQGLTLSEYLGCVELYAAHGVDLTIEPLVGLGTVCRRQATNEAAAIVRRLVREELRLHGFGVKKDGIVRFGDALVSSDSLAWSSHERIEARHGKPSCDPPRRQSCANCLHAALAWRDELVSAIPLRVWEEAPCAA